MKSTADRSCVESVARFITDTTIHSTYVVMTKLTHDLHFPQCSYAGKMRLESFRNFLESISLPSSWINHTPSQDFFKDTVFISTCTHHTTPKEPYPMGFSSSTSCC